MEPVRRPSTYACQHAYNLAMSKRVQGLEVRHKRVLYAHMREGTPSMDMFFPKYGVCASDFTAFKVLNENVRRGNTTRVSKPEHAEEDDDNDVDVDMDAAEEDDNDPPVLTAVVVPNLPIKRKRGNDTSVKE